MTDAVPVIDVFAGPGGLSEGFSSLGRREGNPYFKIALSIENDSFAYQTLLLRTFFRQFPYGEAPDDYYSFIRGEITYENLLSIAHEKYKGPINEAETAVWKATLGSGSEFDKELDKRIADITRNKCKWILIGGPPCQAYSIIGRARKSKTGGYDAASVKRIHLYEEYLKILAKHRPSIFLMENVKGILSSKLNGQNIIHKIINDLENPSKVFQGYDEVSYEIFSLVKHEGEDGRLFSNGLMPEDFVIECEKYGIPQSRHRVILLGIRKDVYRDPPGILKPDKQYSVRDIIQDLPAVRSGLSRERDHEFVWWLRVRCAYGKRWLKSVKKTAGNEVHAYIENLLLSLKAPEADRGSEFIPSQPSLENGLSWWYIDPKIGGVCNHQTKAHIVKDIHRYLYVSSFGKIHGRSPLLHEFPKDLLPDHKNATSGDFDDRFRVQIWSKPASTITSHLSKDGHYFIHPDPAQCRSLTVREAARLQTFPDNYFFCGGRTQQYKQVGNAVPPILAYKIAGIIRDYLEKI